VFYSRYRAYSKFKIHPFNILILTPDSSTSKTMKQHHLFLFLLLLTTTSLTAQQDTISLDKTKETFWEIEKDQQILWKLADETRLPHEDNIELTGQKVAAIISYKVDEKKHLEVERHIIFPQLRVNINSGANKWTAYRAYLKDDYSDQFLPSIVVNNKTFQPGAVKEVRISGMLDISHEPASGLGLHRTFVPSMTERLFVEEWTLTNESDTIKNLQFGNVQFQQKLVGLQGMYTREVYSDAEEEAIDLAPGSSYTFAIYTLAYLNDEPKITSSSKEVLTQRELYLGAIWDNLILETPDLILNTLFAFSKVRASESIFDSPMGLVHSPGGGRYYTGIWANDQAEYSGPFFPYLGYDIGNEAAMNAYRKFAQNLPADYSNVFASFEMGGELPCCGSDRGDAAMIAYGASQYALAMGDPKTGEELWPMIEWCLEYCKRQKNEAGVIKSDSDEMEGRIPTGEANLATSSLAFGGWKTAALLGTALGKSKKQIAAYEMEAAALRQSIESYFGADIEGLHTYQYFEGHPFLRHWICLPLVMGIDERKEGTLDALFSKLWADNGVKVEFNPDLKEPDLFWDRGTLYAFRGAFIAGDSDRAMPKLQAYSKTRLLGFHVPYVVEAWPEGNMAHLSAESALYCRIFTEGLFGIRPVDFKRFKLKPQIPSGWEKMALRNIKAMGSSFDIYVVQKSQRLKILVLQDGKPIFNEVRLTGEEFEVELKY